MNGNPAAAYLGGALHQQYPTFMCGPGPGNPAITLLTFGYHCIPSHHVICTLPPRTFGPLHCSFVCAKDTLNDPYGPGYGPVLGRTIVSPECIAVTYPLQPDLPAPAPQMQQLMAGDCKNVMWTAGCTFAGQQQATPDCKNVMWTAGCTFAGAQQAQPAGGAHITLLTVGPHCWSPTLATHCFICPPPNPCRPIAATRLCTIVGDLADTVSTDVDCKNVMWTAGCTFAGAQPQAQAADCKNVMWTAGCTFAGIEAGAAADCGQVLTTLACTLATPQVAERDAAGNALCATYVTAVPTMCGPHPGGPKPCNHLLHTIICTLPGAVGGDDCGNVLTTLACTLAEDRTAAASADCKHVMWTAGCTFKGLEKGARCGDVLTTLACTLVAAPAEGKTPDPADCKHVLWTAGCTFAAQPQPSQDHLGCKVVAWTAGCTF
jgi:hypothetical protein